MQAVLQRVGLHSFYMATLLVEFPPAAPHYGQIMSSRHDSMITVMQYYELNEFRRTQSQVPGTSIE